MVERKLIVHSHPPTCYSVHPDPFCQKLMHSTLPASETPKQEDINNMTKCISDYIRFCEDIVLPQRTVHCFPNNKPWITSDMKALLNAKKSAFRSGDRVELKIHI